MWKGWIHAAFSDRAELKSLGIKLGPYDFEDEIFTDCELDNKAYNKLEPFWMNTYIWGLDWSE